MFADRWRETTLRTRNQLRGPETGVAEIQLHLLNPETRIMSGLMPAWLSWFNFRIARPSGTERNRLLRDDLLLQISPSVSDSAIWH